MNAHEILSNFKATNQGKYICDSVVTDSVTVCWMLIFL